jgi:hypothetical protein
MSWLDRLRAGLTARGVRGQARERIMLELADHIACEPGGEERLGNADELAARFAEELGTDRSRRSALAAFAALSVTAVAVIASQLLLGGAVGYPGFNHGYSLLLAIPALLGIVIAPQAALVAGGLAALRVLRRRRAETMPAAELALLRGRTLVALGAGLATAVGLELYVIDFSSVLPAWWIALVGTLAASSIAALLLALATLRRASSIRSEAEGPAGDIFDDLPIPGAMWFRRGRWRLGGLAVAAVAVGMTLLEWHAEGSLSEGLQRGTVEAIAAAAGFALFGRAIGAASGSRR